MSSEDVERLGPYVIDGELGRGGMGIVYRGRDPAGRAVAIKRMVVRDAQLAQRLLREGDVRIEHPNVVRVLAAGLDERGDPYVVTELLEGEELPAKAARGASLEALVGYAAQAADGLAAIHAAGIVHRDVKPANLFVTASDVVKVLDFGVARWAAADDLSTASGLTLTGALIGTPAYLAPEQARGSPDIDARADVWGLGMSLFEILSGTLPFRRHSAIATALAVQLEPLPRLGALMPHLPVELTHLVERCLARDRSERWQGAAELAQALRDVARGDFGRPSQPLFHTSIDTWRRVAVVVVSGVDIDSVLVPRLALAGATLVPALGNAAAVIVGRDGSRGDELDRALDLALGLVGKCRAAAVGAGRVRAGTGELDVAHLDPLFALIAIGRSGLFLSPEAASLAPDDLALDKHTDGSARVLHRSGSSSENIEGLLCLGRDSELAALDLHLAACAVEGRPRLIVLEGAAGMGKTTLLRTLLARRGGTAGILVEAGRHEGEPLGALLLALGAEAPPRERIDQALDARRLAVIDALGARLSGLGEASDGEAFAVLVDDADRLDAPSLMLVRDLASIFEGRPLLVVLAGRSPAPADATGKLFLPPLPIPVVRAMLSARARASLDPARIAEIAERSGGSPLFAEQLARSVGVEGASGTDLPLTIESAVQAQLDRLSPDVRSAVYSLSVVGPEGDAQSVGAALGVRAGGLIAALEDAGLVRRVDGGYRFQYRVLVDVAYAAIDLPARVRLHGELAQRLAEVPGVSPDRVLEHAERGGRDTLAARYALEAFFLAANLGDGPRVLSLVERARRSAEHPFRCLFLAAQAAAFVRSGESEPLLEAALAVARSGEEGALARIELAEHRRRRGDTAAAGVLLREARALATEHSDAALRARCREALLFVSEGALGQAESALLIDGLEDQPPSLSALVWDTRGYVAGAQGALGARRLAYQHAARLYAEAGDVRRAAGANANLGDTLHILGDDAGAERTLRRAIDGARKVGNALTEAYALTNLGAVLEAQQRIREALLIFDIASARAIAVGDTRLARVIALYRARAHRVDASDEDLANAASDPTLGAMALSLRIEFGQTRAEHLDAAEALLARAGIEEGVLQLGRVLYARRPSEAIATLLLARVAHALASVEDIQTRARFLESLRRTLGPLAERIEAP